MQAYKRSKEILWLVADLANIPLKDHCADTLLNIFTLAKHQSQVVYYLSQYMQIIEKRRVYYKVKVNTNQLRAWVKARMCRWRFMKDSP